MCYARRQRLSWARIKLSKKLFHWYLVPVNYFLELIFCSSYFSFRVFINVLKHWFYSLEFTSILRSWKFFPLALLSRLSLFNFQGPVAMLPSRRTALTVYHFFFVLSSLFYTFFKTFFVLYPLPSLEVSLIILSYTFSFVNTILIKLSALLFYT